MFIPHMARRDVVRAIGCMVMLGAISGCRSGATSSSPPVPDIPSPVHRTPAITLPPATVSRPAHVSEVLRAFTDSVTSHAVWQQARWGMLVVDVESGDTLMSHDADKLFMPASNQKLLTAAIALRVLGSDYEWRTPVLLDGRQQGTAFTGDIVIVGSGDPSWSDSLRDGRADAAFDIVLDSLARRGIRRVVGTVRVAGDAFEGPTYGAGWEIEDLDVPFGAPVDEVLWNEGLLQLTVRGAARSGGTPVVKLAPTTRHPPITNQATTGSGERLRAFWDSTATSVVVTGSIGINDSTKLVVSYRNPANAVRAALVERLQRAGIRWTERPTSAARCCEGDRSASVPDTLAIVTSVPFPRVLSRMQKPSQNQVAELLYRTAGRKGSASGRPDSARAVATRTLEAMGVAREWVSFRDGSGMSRHNYVTPRALVTVLDAMQKSAHFTLYRDALPVAGTDGTLASRMRGTGAERNAVAKTGTLDKTRSLSGYVTSADGRLLAFSLLCNNYTVPVRDVDRVTDSIVVMLATYPAAR